MAFAEVLAQVIDLLAREKRLAYRALKLRFNLDDEYIAGLKEEMIDAKRLAVDEEGRVLVWTGDAGAPPQPIPPAPQTVHHPHVLPASPLQAASAETAPHHLWLLILAWRNGVHVGNTEEMGIRGNQEVSLFGQACSEIEPIVVGKRIALGVVASS